MKKALFELHLAIFLAGFTGILGKLILLPQGPLVWYRMGLTTLSLLGWMFLTGKLKAIPIQEFIRIAAVGLIVAVHWLCFYGSIKYSNVSIALVCFSSSSFFSALMEPIIKKQRPSLTELALSLVAIVGIYVIMEFNTHYLTGILLGLAAAFFSALFTILNKSLTIKHDAYTITLYEIGAGFLGLCCFIPWYTNHFPTSDWIPSISDWTYLLILSIVCTVWAFSLAINSLNHVSSFTMNLSYNLEPIYGIILAFILFHENKHLHRGFYWGLSLILASVAAQSIRTSSLRKSAVNRIKRFSNSSS